MSYAIVRIQKFTTGSVHGIEIHDKRKKDGISHTNQDINWERTKENYNLIDNKKTYRRLINDRIDTLNFKKAVRKDAIVMAQCLVTSDRDFFDQLNPEQTRRFFKDSYDCLIERYGAENVISATVHMDEKTPHMHFNFVPITVDGRLSAKSLFTPKTLRDQQDVFVTIVGNKYGLQRGKIESDAEHLDVINFKVKTGEERLNNLKQSEREILDSLKKLTLERNRLLEDVSVDSKVLCTLADLRDLKAKKSFLGQNVSLTGQEFDAFKVQAQALVKNAMVTRSENSKLKDQISSLHQQNYSLDVNNNFLNLKLEKIIGKVKDLEAELIHYKEKFLEVSSELDVAKEIFQANPDLKKIFEENKIKKQLSKAIHLRQKPKQKDRSR